MSPQCEKMDFKITHHVLERVQICRKCWKTKVRAGAGVFSEEQQTVELFRIIEWLMNNHHKTERKQRRLKFYFWTWSFFMNSVIILSCVGIYKHMLCWNVLLRRVLNKNNMQCYYHQSFWLMLQIYPKRLNTGFVLRGHICECSARGM